MTGQNVSIWPEPLALPLASPDQAALALPWEGHPAFQMFLSLEEKPWLGLAPTCRHREMVMLSS